MTEDILRKFMEVWGPAGAAVFILGLVVKKMYDKINKLHDERLNDAKAYAKELSEIAANLKSTIDGLTQAINAIVTRK